MKKHHLCIKIFELFIIIAFFVLPSIFATEKTLFTKLSDYVFSFTYTLSAIFLLVYVGKKYKKKSQAIKINHFFASFFVLCVLFWISYIFSFFIATNQEIQKTFFLAQIIYLPLLVSFEEILFRGYIYEAFLDIITKESLKPNKWQRLIALIFSSLLFALAHRYLGIYAMSFAFIASFLLFFLKFYTKNLFFPILVHSIYNLIGFLLAFKT